MNIKDLFFVFLILFVWSSNVLVQKGLSVNMGIISLNLCRFALLVPLVFFVRRPERPLRFYFITAFFWNVLNYILQGYGWKLGVEASISAFLIQTNVFFFLTFSYLLLGRKPLLNQIAGMLFTSIGIFILIFGQEFVQITWTLGLILLVLSAASSGLGFAFLQKYRFQGTLSDSIWLSFASFLMLFPISLIVEGPIGLLTQVFDLSWDQWTGIGYGSFASTALCGALWCRLLQKHQPGVLVPFLLLMPAFTLLLSSFVFDESLSLIQWTACAVMLTGVFIAQLTRFKLIWLSPRRSSQQVT